MIPQNAKQLADEFIKKNIVKYGLNGTNITHNPPFNFPNHKIEHKKNIFIPEKVQWGYNNVPFSWRKSSTCMFYVNYENSTEHTLQELELKQLWNHFIETLTYSNSQISYVFLGELTDLVTLDFINPKLINNIKIIYPYFKDRKFEKYNKNTELILNNQYKGFQKSKININVSDLLNFTNYYCDNVRSTNLFHALRAYLGSQASNFTVYKFSLPQIVDQNYDCTLNKPVGPPNWTLVDNEEDFSLFRFLVSQDHAGLFDFRFQSSSFIKSILNSVSFNDLLKKHSSSGFRTYSLNLNEIFESTSISNQNINESLLTNNHFISENLENELKVRFPKSNESWLSPLNRLYKKFDLTMTLENTHIEDVYGVVY